MCQKSCSLLDLAHLSFASVKGKIVVFDQYTYKVASCLICTRKLLYVSKLLYLINTHINW
jgi:hypothetical protein